MDTLDRKRVRGFFSEIPHPPAGDRIAAVIVTHLLPDRPFFVEAVSERADIVSLLPKPKSENAEMRGWLQHRVPIHHLTRGLFDTGDSAVRFLTPLIGDRRFVLLDIGGYFSPSVQAIANAFGNKFLGVIEDTENGVQRYELMAPHPIPIIEVARSPLKDTEDYLVGQSIVYSTEALLREQGDILHGRAACVIGYGKLGSSIADLLNSRKVRTTVYDVDPLRSIKAFSHGFRVVPTIEDAVRGAGIVFCATGNVSLRTEEFELLDYGAYVATVTSSDDELQIKDLGDRYSARAVAEYVMEYRNKKHRFFLLNRGQAVNFIHGAAVGPFIYLVQGEIVASIARLMSGTIEPGISQNPTELRTSIAKSWYKYFGPPEWRSPNA